MAKPSPETRWFSVVCHLILVICLSACAPPDDDWERVQEAGILRVGMDASFPPFEFIAAEGTLIGFDVDLAGELGRRLGLQIQFVADVPYDGLYDALAVGRVDIVLSALVINPAREADFAYSAPYFDAGQVLVAREGEVGLEGMADLDGRMLAVEFGTRGDLEARKWARRSPDFTVVPYQTAAEALTAVTAGQADATLVDHVSALAAVGPASGLLIVGDLVVSEPHAVAVRKDNLRLLRAVDDALAAMRADGTIDGLVAKWLRHDR